MSCNRPQTFGGGGIRWIVLLSLILLPAGLGAAKAPVESTTSDSAAPALPPVPEAVASFGATVAGDALYVYGGHVGRTHQHSIENLSHRFFRLDLGAPENGWQTIGEVQGLQGLPLVPHGQRVCRVGGLSARNHQGDDEDLVSIADAACFDPEQGWQALPPMPAPRSSHDAAVSGDHLYVVGGWQLRGAGNEPVWQESMAVIDLSAEKPVWQTFSQPFQRRALAVAAAGGKVYAFGGIEDASTSRRVDIYDTATETWSVGPKLPEITGGLKGFGVSAFGVGDRVYLSGGDGVVHSLGVDAEGWQERLSQLETPRFFHRLLPHEERLLFVAGASFSGHLDSLETLAIADLVPGSVAIERGSWPGFRGRGNGRSVSEEVPLEWSSEDDIAWRIRLPGYGQSAPVVHDGQVFVTSVEGPNKEELILSAFDLESGEVHWRRRFQASQTIESSDMVSRGAPTPVVDSDLVFAFWESGDLVALDHDGETLWKRSLTGEYGEFAGNHGVASSPVLTAEAVVVQVTHEGPSYFVAIDKVTGDNRWKIDLPAQVAWTTPVVTRGADGAEILSSAAGRVEAFRAATGERLWHLEGIEKNHVPSLVVDGERVIAASSAPGQSLAVRRDGEGELSDEHIAWRAPEGVTSGFASPIVHGGCALFANKAGALTCLDATSGEERWTHRLPEAAWASPIAAGEHVFYFTKKGRTAVLQPSLEGPGAVAENSLPIEGTVYGAAAVRGAFVLRSGAELVRIGVEPPIVSVEPEGQVVASQSAGDVAAHGSSDR
ncbi:MAG: PQQ-binding-like beta-propeller repeat protein [Acidobacteriota bacterium]